MRAILIKLSGSGFQGPESSRVPGSVGEERTQADVKERLVSKYIEHMSINELTFILKNKTLTKTKD